MTQLTFVDADGREWTVEGYEDDAEKGAQDSGTEREEGGSPSCQDGDAGRQRGL